MAPRWVPTASRRPRGTRALPCVSAVCTSSLGKAPLSQQHSAFLASSRKGPVVAFDAGSLAAVSPSVAHPCCPLAMQTLHSHAVAVGHFGFGSSPRGSPSGDCGGRGQELTAPGGCKEFNALGSLTRLELPRRGRAGSGRIAPRVAVGLPHTFRDEPVSPPHGPASLAADQLATQAPTYFWVLGFYVVGPFCFCANSVLVLVTTALW